MTRAYLASLVRRAWWGLALCLPVVAVAAGPGPAESAEIVHLNRLLPLMEDDPGQAEAALQALAARTGASDPLRWQLFWAQARVAAALGDGVGVARLGEQLQAAGAPKAASLCALGMYQRQYVSVRTAIQTLEPLLAEGAADLDPAIKVPCDLALARTYAARGQPALALRHARAAMQAADTRPDVMPPRVRARAALARYLYATGDGERALYYSDEAMALARESGQDTLQAQVLLDRSAQTPAGAAYAAQRQLLRQQALDLWRTARSTRGTGAALLNLADDALQTGDYAQAEADARAALVVAEQGRLGSDQIGLASHNLGLALIGSGRVREGMALSQQAIEGQRRIEANQRVADLLDELSLQLERVGRDAEAYAVIAEYRVARDRAVSEDRQEAVADLQAQLEADVLHVRQQAQRDQAALRNEREHLAELRQHTLLVVVAVLLGVACLLAAWYRVARRALYRRQRSHAALAQLAAQDALTGLANRQHALDHLAALGTQARGGLMLIDVDRFKQINDQHGHAVGDAVLVELAQRLRRAMRQGDLVARWGGEEFLVHTAGAGRGDAIATLAGRLLADVTDAPMAAALTQTPVRVSVCVGLADWPLAGAAQAPSWDAALAVVDAALYGAKMLGRNRAVVVHRAVAKPADAAAAHAALAQGDWVCIVGPGDPS